MIARAVAAALVLLAIAGAARADLIIGGDVPPWPYDHPYAGKLVIKRANIGWQGIAYPGVGTCLVYINTRLNVPYATVLRHEIGHCNGWPPSHAR